MDWSDTDTLLTLETIDDVQYDHLEKSVDVLMNGSNQISYNEFKVRLEHELGISDRDFIEEIFEENDTGRKGYLTRQECLNLLAGAERDVRGEDLDDEESLTLDFEHMNRQYRDKVNVSNMNFMQDALDPLLVEDLQEKINRLQATGLSMQDIRYLLKINSNSTLPMNSGHLQPLRAKNGETLNRTGSAGAEKFDSRRSKSANRSMSVVRRSRSLARDKPKNGSTKKEKRRERSTSAHRRVVPRLSVSERSMQTRSRPRSMPREHMRRSESRPSASGSGSPSVLTWDPKYNPVGKRRNFHTYNYLSFYQEISQLKDKMLIKGDGVDARSLQYGLSKLGLDLNDFEIQLILTKIPSNEFEDFAIYFIHTKHSGSKLKNLQKKVIKAMVYCGIDVDSLTVPELGSWVSLDDGTTGHVRWIGKIPRNDSIWVGIELENQHRAGGNGNLRGKQYFKCKPGMGVFVRSHRIQKIVN